MEDETALSPRGPEGSASVGSVLTHARTVLADAGIEDPSREARLLLGLALGLGREDLLRLGPAATVPPDRLEAMRALLRRRAHDRAPFALLAGRQGFWSLELEVSTDTLIPRADTEAVVELVLACRPDRGSVGSILDLGTGTGALLLACLSEYRRASGVGIDSEAACRLARRNAARAGLSERARFVVSDWASCLGAGARFDLIVANPPYIARGDIAALMPEVARHEPARALDGGPDGLDAYRAILRPTASLLAPGGIAAFEIGAGQGPCVAGLAVAAGLAPRGTRHDLAGILRALAFGHAEGAAPDRGAVAKTLGARRPLR